jgi:hypothetical protein
MVWATHSVRLRARILASTWVESVRCRPRAVPPSTLPAPLQEQIQQTLFGIALDQTWAKFGKDGMVKARIGQLQAERVFPRQPITHGESLLAIRQPFHKLEHCH